MPACDIYGSRRARFGPLRLRGLHAQLVADELEGGCDGLVHVVVLVAAQASGEDHVALLRRQLLVLPVQRLVLGVVDGVVGLVAWLPVGRVLARDDGPVLVASGTSKLRCIDSKIGLYELKGFDGANREMIYAICQGADKIVLLFWFKGHQGSGNISKEIERAKRLAVIARQLLETER